MLGASRTSEMLTVTLPSSPAMLNGFPPYSGIKLSISTTSAPAATRRAARFEPMNPRPPVMMTFLPRNHSSRRSLIRLSLQRERIALDVTHDELRFAVDRQDQASQVFPRDAEHYQLHACE